MHIYSLQTPTNDFAKYYNVALERIYYHHFTLPTKPVPVINYPHRN